MCAYQIAWPSCYTTLAWVRHCFPSHYPRSGQRSLHGGNVTRRIARWAFQDGHLVSFDFCFSFFLVCFLSYSPMLSNSDCLYLESTVLLICSAVIFVILVCCFDYCPTPQPPLSFLLQLRLVCDWILSRLLQHTGGMCVTHGMLGGWLTLDTALSPCPVDTARG